MKFFVFSLIAFALYYLYNFFYARQKLAKLDSLIASFNSLLADIPKKETDNYEEYKKKIHLVENRRFSNINDFVALMPQINDLLQYDSSSYTLSYNQSDYQNFEAVGYYYQRLLEVQDIFEFKSKKYLNPIYLIQGFFLLPSSFLKYLGIHLKLKSSRIVSFLIWFFGTLISLYGDEVKIFINSLLGIK